MTMTAIMTTATYTPKTITIILNVLEEGPAVGRFTANKYCKKIEMSFSLIVVES